MHEKWLIILLLLCHISFSYEHERDIKIKTFDSARSYPIKVSHYNNNRPKQQPLYGKLMKVKSVSDQNTQKVKREHIDNVKGEMLPQSRRDILNIKKVSFHGRDRPSAEQSGQNNATESAQNDYSYENDYDSIRPSSRNDHFSEPTKSKQEYHTNSNDVEDIQPPYVPDNSPFYPLMKPSPINVMPTEPPSFDTVRNYVQYLKMRQQKFFSDFDNDNQPVPEVRSKHVVAPFEGEIDYFKEREHELAREEELRNQFSPTNYIKTLQSTEDVVEHPNTDNSSGSNESETITKNDYEENADIQRADNDDDDDDDVIASNEYSDNSNNHYADYADETVEEESKKTENFVPFRLYAQVRHVEADHHEKPSKSHVKEKVSLAKKNIYYKEEGYEDKNYDHGAEKIDYDFKEKKNKKPRQQHSKKRSKRSTDGDIDVSQLPVALAYIKKSEIPQLTGEKLFQHLDELIKNSSIYLPDDDDVHRPIRFVPVKHSSKYPYYNTPETILSQMSAHRYSENLKNYPQPSESLYKYKNTKPCEDIPDDIDPVPKDIEDEGKNTKFNESPKRLNNLGDKIQCIREKYFGKDPFDNPLFKEDEYVEATIPIPVNHNLSRQANPLITVYDDVINNIRSGILNDFKRKREAEDVLKQASEKIALKAKQVEIPNYSSVSGIAQLPIFDINTFLPKFKGSIGKFSAEDDDDDSNEEISSINSLKEQQQNRKRKRNNLSLDDQKLDPPKQYLKNSNDENPKVKRNNNSKKKKKNNSLNTVPETPPKPISTVIKNVQQPKIIKTISSKNSNQKFRRFISPNAYVYPATKHITTYSQSLPPPQSNGKTTYRFKLL